MMIREIEPRRYGEEPLWMYAIHSQILNNPDLAVFVIDDYVEIQLIRNWFDENYETRKYKLVYLSNGNRILTIDDPEIVLAFKLRWL